MRLKNTTNVKIAIFILLTAVSYNMAIFSLGSPLKRLKETGSIFSLIGRDDKTLLDNDYAELRQSLPQYGVVGYVVNKNELFDINDNLHFHMMKYAVAPVLVGSGENYDYVIGNLYQDDVAPQTIIHQMEKKGFKIVQKVSDRLVVFRRNSH